MNAPTLKRTTRKNKLESTILKCEYGSSCIISDNTTTSIYISFGGYLTPSEVFTPTEIQSALNKLNKAIRQCLYGCLTSSSIFNQKTYLVDVQAADSTYIKLSKKSYIQIELTLYTIQPLYLNDTQDEVAGIVNQITKLLEENKSFNFLPGK